jgi:hypothetical protein
MMPRYGMKKFNEWMKQRESNLCESNLWERHKELPSLFMRTHYALPTQEQLEEFQEYPNLTAEDIVQGVGYTIVGRSINSQSNFQKIIESIKMLVDRYPERKTYQEALTKAKEEAREWRNNLVG